MAKNLRGVKLPKSSTNTVNVRDYGMRLVKNYYMDGIPGVRVSTIMVHKKYVDSNGNFKLKHSE